MSLRGVIRAVTPPILLDLLRMLLRKSAAASAGQASAPAATGVQSPMSGEECRALVARMDRGDFEFDGDTVNHMLAMWRFDNALAPYPSALASAHSSGDAVAMNSRVLMEVSYRLPYSLAYEESQSQKYRACIRMAEKVGIEFRGATVVDAGCGLGGLLQVVHQLHPDARLRAVECAHSAVEFIGRNRPHLNGVVSDLEGDTDAFVASVGADADIVLITEVLEHLLRPEHAVRNAIALRPRRGIVLTVPNGRVDTAAQHIQFWSPESWRLFVDRFAGEWRVAVDRCPSPGSPDGFDNFAALLPR